MAAVMGGWLSAATRFAGLPRAAAMAVLALLAFTMLGGFALERTTINAETGLAGGTPREGADQRLYERIVAEMRAGTPYYAAAAPALREGDYPLRPFAAFRLPTLASLLASLPDIAAYALLVALAGAALAAWTVSLRPAFSRVAPAAIACVLLAASAAVTLQPAMIVFHEVWAALLIALSLALRRDHRWWPAVIAGLAAVLIRETALAYLLVMAGIALIERRWCELAAWGAAMALFAAVLVLHALQVVAVTSAADPASPGWMGLGGWRFLLSMTRLTTPLIQLPFGAAAMLVPLALLGWSAWRAPIAMRTLATLGGYAVIFMIFARPDNFYWGLLIAPLLLAGLAFVPAALADLLAAARAPRARLDRTTPAGH